MSTNNMHTLLAVLSLIAPVIADPTDWVSAQYVRQHSSASKGDSSTSDAQNAIVRNAQKSSKHDSWSIKNTNGYKAPSNDSCDYFSWAPYHWPNCNWCPSGRSHFIQPDGSSGDAPDDSSDESDPDANYESMDDVFRRAAQYHAHHAGMIKRKRDFDPIGDAVQQVPQAAAGLPINTVGLFSTTTAHTVGTPAPAQAAAKTKTSKSSCTPSPTKSMAPSATWTTCPYVTRDGQVNPDARSLRGPGVLNDISDAILSNSLSYVFTGGASYCQALVSMLDVFFLAESTRMNPNMKYGQMVRGPGPKGVQGTFTGVLDMRGMVKIVAGLLVAKDAKCPGWTGAREQGIEQWMSTFLDWLLTSDIGKMSATRPNNHGTFFAGQVTVVKMYGGDTNAAADGLRAFFKNQFLDQISASGEQPFEAVRTRPFHYRCFNLEALVVLAKLCRELGFDCWSLKSKYGATIQTAINFVIRVDPKDEDLSDCASQVAAAAAVYGDPDGRYGAWLLKALPNYKSQPFWYYDQPSSLKNSAAKSKRMFEQAMEDASPELPPVYECPDIVKNAGPEGVELDNGVFVTCPLLLALPNLE